MAGDAPDPILGRLEQAPGAASGARSFAWASGSRMGQQAAQFAASVALARLLLPADYGLYAVIGSVVLFANFFTDLGLAAAIVHTSAPSRSFLSTAFWINAITGVALTLLSFALGPALAAIYNRPRLIHLMLIAGLNFGLDLGIVHTALLERTMRFKRLAVLETVATILGIGVSIGAAAAGLGPTSLALGPLAGTVAQSVMLWIAVPWRPGLAVSRNDAVGIARYGRGLVGFNITNYWSRNADNLLLGRFASATALGLYSRAYNLMSVPIFQINAVLGRVLFPTLTRVRDQQGAVGATWLRATKLTIAAALPVALLFATAAPALVAGLYGPRWHGAAILLELLSFAAVAQLLPATTGPVFQALGKTDAMFRLGLAMSTATVAAIVAGLPWGATGVAAGILIRSWVLIWVPVRVACRYMGLPLRRVAREMVGLTLAGVAFTAASFAARLGIGSSLPALLLLLVQGLLGTAAMLYVLAIVDRPLITELRSSLRRITDGVSLRRRGRDRSDPTPQGD
jgi:O-antigen/teichoic acid export membrane protein